MGLWSVVRCGVVSVNGMEAQSRGTHVVDGSERGTTWKGEDGRTRGGGGCRLWDSRGTAAIGVVPGRERKRVT